MAGDITSANTILLLSVPLILPVPQQIQAFAADDIFDADDVDATETMMGVDGRLSGGMVYMPKPMNFALQADSDSIAFFDAWYQGQQSAVGAFPASGTVTFPSIGKSYALIKGFLKRYKPMADGKKVLQPQKFRIEWEQVLPSPVGFSG